MKCFEDGKDICLYCLREKCEFPEVSRMVWESRMCAEEVFPGINKKESNVENIRDMAENIQDSLPKTSMLLEALALRIQEAEKVIASGQGNDWTIHSQLILQLKEIIEEVLPPPPSDPYNDYY